MKASKLFAAGLFALAAVSMTYAQPVIRITGSTAFRKATSTAIKNILAPGFVWGGVGGADVGNAQLIFSGNLASNGHAVIIKTAYVGSEGGIYDLTHPGTPPTNTKFIDNSQLGALTAAGATITAANANEVVAADIGLSDSFQSSSIWTSPTLNDAQVGVIPFVWISAAGNDAPIAGITHQQAKATLLGLGSLNLWSGDFATDGAIAVRAIGRDEDSGTRVIAFQESTFGSGSSPVQYQPIGSAGAYSGLQPWPAATVNTVSYGAGHSGYSSGGTLAGVVTDASVNLSADVISYLGQSDATTAIKAGATGLPWEGVQFIASSSPTAVTYNNQLVFDGKYTFWSYEHLLSKSAPSSPEAATAAADIATRLGGANTDANLSGYHLNQLNVKRLVDGGPVFNK